MSSTELGIIKSVYVEGGKVNVLFAFSFTNIPIGNHLITSVVYALKEHGLEVKTDTTVMTPEERQRFLAMEQQGLIGDV